MVLRLGPNPEEIELTPVGVYTGKVKEARAEKSASGTDIMFVDFVLDVNGKEEEETAIFPIQSEHAFVRERLWHNVVAMHGYNPDEPEVTGDTDPRFPFWVARDEGTDVQVSVRHRSRGAGYSPFVELNVVRPEDDVETSDEDAEEAYKAYRNPKA